MAGRSRLGTATRLPSTAARSAAQLDKCYYASQPRQLLLLLLPPPPPPARPPRSKSAAATAATAAAAAAPRSTLRRRRSAAHRRSCSGAAWRVNRRKRLDADARISQPPASGAEIDCARRRARSATTAERREVVPFAIFDGDAVHWRARHSLCQASRHRRRSTQTSQTRIPNGTHRRTGTQSQTPRPTHALIHKNTLTTYSLSHTQTQTQTPTQTQTQTHTHLRQAKDKQRGRVVRLEAGPPHRRQQLPRLGPPSLCGGSDGTGVALAGSRPSAAAGANAITPRTAQTPYFFLQRRGAGEGMSDTGIKRSHQTVAEPL